MVYFDFLKMNTKRIQNDIELLITKYKVEPVGNGYIDMIINNDLVEEFISELTKSNIIVEGVTWWCHFTKTSEIEIGCPHGMGGPISDYYEGWFSETQIPIYEVTTDKVIRIDMNTLSNGVKEINSQVINYIKYDFPKSDEYLKCLVPALWLLVPEDWKR